MAWLGCPIEQRMMMVPWGGGGGGRVCSCCCPVPMPRVKERGGRETVLVMGKTEVEERGRQNKVREGGGRRGRQGLMMLPVAAQRRQPTALLFPFLLHQATHPKHSHTPRTSRTTSTQRVGRACTGVGCSWWKARAQRRHSYTFPSQQASSHTWPAHHQQRPPSSSSSSSSWCSTAPTPLCPCPCRRLCQCGPRQHRPRRAGQKSPPPRKRRRPQRQLRRRPCLPLLLLHHPASTTRHQHESRTW